MLAVQIGMIIICSLPLVSCWLYFICPLLSLLQGFLEKPYRCSPSLQIGLQPIEPSCSLDNSKTMHSIITLHMLYHENALSTRVVVPPCTSLVKPCPHRESFKICFLNSPYLLERRFWKVTVQGCFLWTYIYQNMQIKFGKISPHLPFKQRCKLISIRCGLLRP